MASFISTFRLRVIIFLFVSIVAGALFGLLGFVMYQKVGFAPSNEQIPQGQSATFMRSAQYSGITITSDLPPATLREIGDFLTVSVRKELLPSHIELQKMSKNAMGENEYAGGWNARDYEFNILSVADSKGISQYFRVWVLIPKQKITADTSISLLHKLYSETAIKEVGPVRCANVAGKQGQNETTVCEYMTTDGLGKKIGALVRSPLLIGQDTKLMVVSFCAIPKESGKYATTDFCI